MKKVLIINGAARIGGNTDKIVQKIIDGAINVNITPDLVILREKKIGECIGCYQCLRKQYCSLKDDMIEIHRLIQKSDILIIASPLYWCGVTGLMKTFIDRLFYYYHKDTKRKIHGKECVVVTPLNQQNVVYETEILIHFYNRLLNCLGIHKIIMYFFGEIMTRDDLSAKPEYMSQAFSIGQSLNDLFLAKDREKETIVRMLQ